MSLACSKTVVPVKGGYRYEVRCNGKVVACGVRSTPALANTAASRELAVYKQIDGGAARRPSASKRSKAPAKRTASRR